MDETKKKLDEKYAWQVKRVDFCKFNFSSGIKIS